MRQAALVEDENPSRRLCLLMADIEDGMEHEFEAWTGKKRRAPSDAGWTGGGMRLDEWGVR